MGQPAPSFCFCQITLISEIFSLHTCPGVSLNSQAVSLSSQMVGEATQQWDSAIETLVSSPQGLPPLHLFWTSGLPKGQYFSLT